MFARVKGAEFDSVIKMINGSKTSVNFKYMNGVFLLQSMKTLIHNTYMNIEECDTKDGITEITVELLPLMKVFQGYKDITEIWINEGSMIIRQGNRECRLEKDYSERVDDVLIDNNESNYTNTTNWMDTFIDMRTMFTISKSLHANPTRLVVLNKQAYITYSNTLLICDVDMPDMCIKHQYGMELLHAMTRANNCTYSFNEDKSVLRLILNSKEYIYVLCDTIPILQTIQLKKLSEDLEHVTSFDFTKHITDVESAAKSLNTSIVELSICDGDYRFYITRSGFNFSIGSDDIALMNIKITSAQLQVILKLLKSCSNVEVLKGGGNLICLKFNNKMLLLSGMRY